MRVLLCLVAGAALVAVAMGQSSKGDKCSMCEYVLESIDRAVKSKPRMIGGGGYYPGVMDFGGGIQKGNYRVYPGSYLQENEKEGHTHVRGRVAQARTAKSNRPSWYGRRRAPRRVGPRRALDGRWGANADHLRAFAERRFRAAKAVLQRRDKGRYADPRGESTALLQLRQREPDEDGPHRADDPLKAGDDLDQVYHTMHEPSNYDRKYDVPEKGENHNRPLLEPRFMARGQRMHKPPARKNDRAPVGGKFGYTDKDRVDSQAEKSDEFAYMYKNFMDAMDDVCYRDLPKDWLTACQPLYEKGDKLVEMYLHDYDDWEICTEVQTACKDFWEALEGGS